MIIDAQPIAEGLLTVENQAVLSAVVQQPHDHKGRNDVIKLVFSRLNMLCKTFI